MTDNEGRPLKKGSSFGRELRSLRKFLKLSHADIGRASGYNHSYISRLEDGTRVPTFAAVQAIADGLDLPEDDRLGLHEAAPYMLPGYRLVREDERYVVVREEQLARMKKTIHDLSAVVRAMSDELESFEYPRYYWGKDDPDVES